MTDTNPRAVIGGNGGPIDPREALEIHVADLIEQTEGSAYGQALETQGQADAIALLLRRVQDAAKQIDAQADSEKAPHQTIIDGVNEWRNGYNAAKLKKTPDGKLTKAETVLKNLMAGWLKRQEDERKQREAEAAAEAARLAQEAMAAHKDAAQSTDLEAINSAEDMLAAAKTAIKQADRVAKEKPRTEVEGFRNVTARKTYTAKVTNYAEAYGHYKKQPEFMADFHALIERYAKRDERNEAARLAGVAGVEFIEGLKV